jgi:hypothetical protein
MVILMVIRPIFFDFHGDFFFDLTWWKKSGVYEHFDGFDGKDLFFSRDFNGDKKHVIFHGIFPWEKQHLIIC